MSRRILVLLLFLGALPPGLLAKDPDYIRPRYNFSSYDIRIRSELLATGVTLVFYGESQPLLNGFFAPFSFLNVDGRRVRVNRAIFVNIDLVLRNGGSVDRVVAHELAHFRQFQRCASREEYLREWRRQQALPYWQRPWEKEAHEAEKQTHLWVRVLGPRQKENVRLVFESDRDGLAALPPD